MFKYLEIIISLLFLLIIFFIKRNINKKIVKEYPLYNKINKITKILFFISIIIPIIYLIIYFILNHSISLTITYNTVLFFFILCPITIYKSYNIYFKDEEKYSHIQYVVTQSVPTSKELKKYHKSHINLIILNNDIKLKIKSISINKLELTNISSNIIIKDTTIEEFKHKYPSNNQLLYSSNLDTTYKKIYTSRGVHDNYIRNLRKNLTFNLILILTFIGNTISNFPLPISITSALVLKLLMIIESKYYNPKLPFDIDIENRFPKPENIIFGRQDLTLSIIIAIIAFCGLNLSYNYLITETMLYFIPAVIYHIILTFEYLLYHFMEYSEELLTINIIKAIPKKRLIIPLIFIIIIFIVFSFISKIGLYNCFGSFVIAFLSLFLYEIIKILRLLPKKGKSK